MALFEVVTGRKGRVKSTLVQPRPRIIDSSAARNADPHKRIYVCVRRETSIIV